MWKYYDKYFQVLGQSRGKPISGYNRGVTPRGDCTVKVYFEDMQIILSIESYKSKKKTHTTTLKEEIKEYIQKRKEGTSA